MEVDDQWGILIQIQERDKEIPRRHLSIFISDLYGDHPEKEKETFL